MSPESLILPPWMLYVRPSPHLSLMEPLFSSVLTSAWLVTAFSVAVCILGLLFTFTDRAALLAFTTEQLTVVGLSGASLGLKSLAVSSSLLSSTRAAVRRFSPGWWCVLWMAVTGHDAFLLTAPTWAGLTAGAEIFRLGPCGTEDGLLLEIFLQWRNGDRLENLKSASPHLGTGTDPVFL